jgi:hypothetical protein
LRAKIVLAAAEGKTNEAVAAELRHLGTDRRTFADPLCQTATGGDREGRSPPWADEALVKTSRAEALSQDGRRITVEERLSVSKAGVDLVTALGPKELLDVVIPIDFPTGPPPRPGPRRFSDQRGH